MFPMRRGVSSRAAVTNSVLPRGWALSITAAVFAFATAGGALADNTKINLAQVVKKTVLVFPFDMPADGPPNKDDVSQLMTDTVVSRLLASGQYTVIQYHKTLPPVARLRLDQQLTDSDVAAPFADDTSKATKIAKLVGYDVAFLGAVDEYTYNEADNQADVVGRGQLLDIKTGKTIGAPVILKASSAKGGTAKQPEKAMDAARAVGSQLGQKLIPIASTPVPVPTNPVTKTPAKESQKKKHNNNGILYGLLAIGLGLGIGLATSGGGHGSSSGSDNPPAPP
jgi:hypothetical protein